MILAGFNVRLHQPSPVPIRPGRQGRIWAPVTLPEGEGQKQNHGTLSSLRRIIHSLDDRHFQPR